MLSPFLFLQKDAIITICMPKIQDWGTRNNKKYGFCLVFVPFPGQLDSLCPSSPHILHFFRDPFLDPPSHQLVILYFLVLQGPFLLVGICAHNTKHYPLVSTESCL